MRKVFLVGVVVVVACTSSSGTPTQDPPDSGYTYAGCPLAEAYCPRDLTLVCALNSIAQSYNTCAGDSDCVLTPLDPLCSGQGTCPPFPVNDAGAASFRSLAQAEVNKYCDGMRCNVEGLCGFSSFHAICDAGRCGFTPDAGP